MQKQVTTFLTISQAFIRWIDGDGSKNCCMVAFLYVFFIKSRELNNN